jgi:hypothetical protein
VPQRNRKSSVLSVEEASKTELFWNQKINRERAA